MVQVTCLESTGPKVQPLAMWKTITFITYRDPTLTKEVNGTRPFKLLPTPVSYGNQCDFQNDLSQVPVVIYCHLI